MLYKSVLLEYNITVLYSKNIKKIGGEMNLNGLNLINFKKAVMYMNIVKFGAYISRLRKERDMPQSKLADILNVTRQAVSKWERGEGFPDISILCEVANVFGVSVDTLLGAGEASNSEAAILSSVTQNQEIAKEVFEDKGVVQDVINIAPYLKASTLSAIAEKLARHNINISKIVELAEFMNDESIIKLFQNSDLEKLDDELLDRLVPFLDQDSLYVLLEKFMNGENKVNFRNYIDHSLFEAAWMQGVMD